MTKRTPKPPATFERRGKSYAGYATAIRTGGGAEVIILAPTLAEAERLGCLFGNCIVNRDLVRRAVLVGEQTFNELEKSAQQPHSKEPA